MVAVRAAGFGSGVDAANDADSVDPGGGMRREPMPAVTRIVFISVSNHKSYIVHRQRTDVVTAVVMSAILSRVSSIVSTAAVATVSRAGPWT